MLSRYSEFIKNDYLPFARHFLPLVAVISGNIGARVVESHYIKYAKYIKSHEKIVPTLMGFTSYALVGCSYFITFPVTFPLMFFRIYKAIADNKF